MRRFVIMLLCLCSVLTSCSFIQKEEAQPIQPVEFYYCSVAHVYESSTGVLQAEVRDLGEETWSAEEILGLYFRGPQTESLTSPFPTDLRVEAVSLENGILYLSVNNALEQLSGIDLTVAVACIVKTMTQLPTVDKVEIRADGKMLNDVIALQLDDSAFLSEDDSATSDQTSVKLYFSDVNNRYLVEETRNQLFSPDESVPNYIVNQLLAGPKNRGSYAAIPFGTTLIGTQVNNGVCTVNFSSGFQSRTPETHAQARMAVFSIVNSLTELQEIECVRFLCVGSPIASYAGIDLSRYLYREELAFGHSTASVTLDSEIFVPCESCLKLAEVPLPVRRTPGRSLYADVLAALISFEPANGYGNYIPDGTAVTDVQLQNGVCHVTFNSVFAQCDEDAGKAELAVRSVVTTLCALDDVDAVQITVQDANMVSVDLSQPLHANLSWVLP